MDGNEIPIGNMLKLKLSELKKLEGNPHSGNQEKLTTVFNNVLKP